MQADDIGKRERERERERMIHAIKGAIACECRTQLPRGAPETEASCGIITLLVGTRTTYIARLAASGFCIGALYAAPAARAAFSCYGRKLSSSRRFIMHVHMCWCSELIGSIQQLICCWNTSPAGRQAGNRSRVVRIRGRGHPLLMTRSLGRSTYVHQDGRCIRIDAV